MERTVCLSVATYWLGRTLGIGQAMDEFHRQLERPTAPGTLACVRTIHRLRHLVDVRLHVDTGASVIGKARSRAFHAACSAAADAWIMCDDDVEATSDTLGWALQAVWGPEPRMVIAPCVLRAPEGSRSVTNIQLPKVQVERRLLSGGTLVTCDGGGLGLAVLNRAALDELVAWAPDELVYRDDDGIERIALFHDELADGKWWGEDLSFCRRVRAAGITIEALTSGATCHAGYPLELSRLRLS